MLRDLEVQLTEVELPDLPYMSLVPLLYVEAAVVFEDLMVNGEGRQLVFGEAGPGWPHVWRQARAFSAVDYVQADRVRRLAMVAFDRLFESVDLLCGPLYGDSIELVVATNFSGHPGLTLRVGFNESPTRTIFGGVTDASAPAQRVTQNIAIHGRLFEEGKMPGPGQSHRRTRECLAGASAERLSSWPNCLAVVPFEPLSTRIFRP